MIIMAELLAQPTTAACNFNVAYANRAAVGIDHDCFWTNHSFHTTTANRCIIVVLHSKTVAMEEKHSSW